MNISRFLLASTLASSCMFAVVVPTGGGDAEVRGILRIEEFGTTDGNGMETTYNYDSGDAEVRFMSTTDSVLWEWGYYDGTYFVPQMVLDEGGGLSIEKMDIGDGEFWFDSAVRMVGGSYSFSNSPYTIVVGMYNDLDILAPNSMILGTFNQIEEGAEGSLTVGIHNRIAGSGFAFGKSITVSSGAENAFGHGELIVLEGKNSSAFGYYTTSSAYAGMVLGQYNQAATKNGNVPVAASWQGASSDPGPVFEVGVGTSSSNLKNGLTVFQDGSVVLGTDDLASDVVLARAQGDISMGIFGTAQ